MQGSAHRSVFLYHEDCVDRSDLESCVFGTTPLTKTCRVDYLLRWPASPLPSELLSSLSRSQRKPITYLYAVLNVLPASASCELSLGHSKFYVSFI